MEHRPLWLRIARLANALDAGSDLPERRGLVFSSE